MTPWPVTPALDHVIANRWHRDIKILAGEVLDCFDTDSSEALAKLDGMAGMLGEMRALVLREVDAREDGRARDERETSIPPVMS